MTHAWSNRITDDRGREHELRHPPRRIVSLVPSDTYSLVRLGAADRIVGRTRYCVEPAEALAGVEMVGGTKDADIEKIAALKPDLVIANQEENSRPDIQKLDALGLRVLVSFPQTVAAGLAHLARLARALGEVRGAEAFPGRLPVTGERIACAGWVFEVVDLDGKRIDKVLATLTPGAED